MKLDTFTHFSPRLPFESCDFAIWPHEVFAFRQDVEDAMLTDNRIAVETVTAVLGGIA